MNRIEFGDCRDIMRRWAAEGVRVQTCITSPPYYRLRDYGIAGQLGLEKTPEQYVANMVEVFRCVRDVLADDGTLWLNIGDTYASKAGGYDSTGSQGATSMRPISAGTKAAVLKGTQRRPPPGIHTKELIGIPWMLAFALRADGWRIRQDVIWSKSNPMPESVRDRCTKSHEYVFLLTKGDRYFFDNEAIKEPAVGGVAGNVNPVKGAGDDTMRTRDGLHAYAARARSRRNSFARETKASEGEHGQKAQHRPGRYDVDYGGETRNRRSVWSIPTKPYKGAHFAVFPEALVDPCVAAGTSERGHCPRCMKRWKRKTRPAIEVAHTGETSSAYPEGSTANRLSMLRQAAREQGREYTGSRITVGWVASCKCGVEPVADVVLDPFIGSGTTAVVAIRHGRQYLGCELNPGYRALQVERIAGANAPAPTKKPRQQRAQAPAVAASVAPAQSALFEEIT